MCIKLRKLCTRVITLKASGPRTRHNLQRCRQGRGALVSKHTLVQTELLQFSAQKDLIKMFAARNHEVVATRHACGRPGAPVSSHCSYCTKVTCSTSTRQQMLRSHRPKLRFVICPDISDSGVEQLHLPVLWLHWTLSLCSCVKDSESAKNP